MEELSRRFKYSALSEKMDELKSFIGRKILKMDKIFFYDPDEYTRRDNLYHLKYEGSIVLTFEDGDEYSFFGDEGGSNSICMRLEKTTNSVGVYNYSQSKSNRYIFEDKDIVYKISTDEFIDDKYRLLLNQKIVEINILTTNNLSPKEQCVPSDKGLEFIFDNGRKLILLHNLTEDSFVFGVLTEKDRISPDTILKFKIA
jgi:hypothetical protein